MKFAPELTYRIAFAHNREEAFEDLTDILLVNHDAAKWVLKNAHVLEGFKFLCIDESTAYKNPGSQRSKAMAAIAGVFDRKVLMTGTPTPNGIIDIWHQIKLVDDGERLGRSYWKFRSATHTPISRGPFTEWEEKDDIQEAIYGLIHDVNIRHKFEECVDIPANRVRTIQFKLTDKHMQVYQDLKNQAMLTMANMDQVTAVNAAALATKLMQVASGSVYGDGTILKLAKERYELITDLIEEREQCLVAFNWTHQRDALVQMAKKRKFTYAIIDGSQSIDARTQAVSDFQAGHVKVIYAHPASASHGLTLTAGTTTIWSSPTYDAEKYQQFNRRIYRAGQDRKTETILIAGAGTIDIKAYKRLEEKVTKMTDLLELLQI
jgi:SNF2 family DNA or RNA helicase